MKKSVLAGIVAILGLVIFLVAPSTAAHASNPVPYPHSLSNHPYATGWTGSQMHNSAWENASNDPANCTSDNTSEITTVGSAVKISTSGATGDCAYLQSVHTYPTVDGYVYEEEVNVSNWTQWESFWGYGNNWPTDGEIDAIEGGSGTNYVSWHDSTTPPDGFSNCNSSNGCDSSMAPITTPSNTNTLTDISPGTHYIDFAFGGCGTGCGAVSVWYDGTEVAYVSGSQVLDGGSNSDPFWIDTDTGSCNQPSNGDVCGSSGQTSGNITIDYLRIFT